MRSTGASGRSWAAEAALPALTFALALALWELAPRVGWVRAQSVPPFSDVLAEALRVVGRDPFLGDLRASAQRWAIGFALAIAIGVPLGIAMGRSRLWAAVIFPAALPEILSGLRIAIAISIFTLLASELLIRGSGIGASMFTALDNGQTVTVFAMSAIVASGGFVVDRLYVAAVRRALPWFEGEV